MAVRCIVVAVTTVAAAVIPVVSAGTSTISLLGCGVLLLRQSFPWWWNGDRGAGAITAVCCVT
jgi:hypothetical protein